MRGNEAIQRLCKLACDVSDVLITLNEPNDCFCADAYHTPEQAVVCDEVIKFIEEAVRDKLQRS